MATCKQTAAELLQDLFSPCVAVLCGDDVETICAKNNLTFVEMVQPFCRINTEITIRDPSNVPCSIRNLRIIMRDMHSQTPPLNVGKKVMHDAVASNATISMDGVMCSSVVGDNYEIKYNASTPWFEAYRDVFFQVLSPMEHEFLHHYLSCIFVVSSSHHDPLSHIHDLCQQQAQFQLQNSQHNSRWFFTHVFKYYLLLHDTSTENLAKAEAIYQSMKSSYGSTSCHLLQINSSKSEGSTNLNSHEEMNGALNLPDPWIQFFPKYYSQQDSTTFNEIKENLEIMKSSDESSVAIDLDPKEKKDTIDHPLQASAEDALNNDSYIDALDKAKPRTSSLNYGPWGKNSNRNKKHGLCLTQSDMDRIKVFVQDFCVQGLVPFVEKQMRVLNDLVTNRKGIHRTLFGVTKKLFAGNKPGTQGPITSPNSVIYGQDAPELQVRKLGDLAFMFQLFETAYQAYHTAKRDFSGDQAWLYFAGASEMAALSVFMQGNSNVHEYPARYMETAITTYLHTCKVPELAMRSTFLSTECLKAKGLYRDAALQFMRMPSETDLPCALFLEQAAHCFISCKPPKLRKYAFHMVLAGHRFSKAGQKKHGLRCYRQAEQAYSHLDWNFANNHIQSMIGRFSLHLNLLDGACEAFRKLLISQCHKPTGDHANHFRDYLHALKQSLSQQQTHENSQLPCLPVPFINCQYTKVLLGEDNIISEDGSLLIRSRGFDRAELNNDTWTKLEEMMIVSLKKTLPPLHVPQIHCFTQETNNSIKPIAVTNEIITIEVAVRNPLNIQLTAENIFLLWTFTANPDVTSNKEPVSFSNELEFSKAAMLNSVIETSVLPQVIFEPFQEQKLRLTLKPVRIGTLLVRGLSYGLLSPVNPIDAKSASETVSKSNRLSLQGKQLIEVKGPRLNKTAEDRTSKSYAVDNRLNIEVVASLPKLEVKYEAFPSSLFCGEVSQTVVEFKNVGHELLKRIVMASPTPSVFSLGHGVDSMVQIYEEVPCSRHFVPVMSEWSDCDWKCEVLMQDGSPVCLRPGESHRCLLFLRGPDVPGEHNVELLMYYETEPAHPKLSHRLLQHSFVMDAKPSLGVQANALVSQRYEDETVIGNQSIPSSGSLILALDVGNISEELSELSIMQVSCASPKWHLSSSSENLPKGFPVILPRECHLLSFKASSLKISSTDSSQEAVVFSRVPLGCFEIDSSSVPCYDFTNKSRIYIPDLQSDSSELCMPKVENTLLLLTVIWKAQYQKDGLSNLIVGQHHIKILNLASATGETASQRSDLQPPVDSAASFSAPMAAQLVRCCLRYPFKLQHDFSKARLKTVPVEFIAQSTCDSLLQITIDNSDCHISQTVSYALEENQSLVQQLFTWVGGSKRKIHLKPGETARIRLCASFSSPGTYNLGCLGISINHNNEAAVNYIMPPYLIIISACDPVTNT